MNSHHNEFCAISICFIHYKVYSNEWSIQCGLGVKILSLFFISIIHTSPFLVFNCDFDN